MSDARVNNMGTHVRAESRMEPKELMRFNHPGQGCQFHAGVLIVCQCMNCVYIRQRLGGLK